MQLSIHEPRVDEVYLGVDVAGHGEVLHGLVDLLALQLGLAAGQQGLGDHQAGEERRRKWCRL